MDKYTKYPFSLEFYILIVSFVPCGLMISIPNLKRLAPFSLAAITVSFIALIAIVYYISDLPPIQERSLYGSPVEYPIFFGTVLFATSAVGVVGCKNFFTNKIILKIMFSVC